MAVIPSVHAALNAAKSEVGAVGKDQRNTQQNFNFRGIDAVVNAVAPALNNHGIVVIPELVGSPVYESVEIGAKRTPMAHVILVVKYRFIGPAGDEVCAIVPSESMDSGDKAMAKAMSVAFRIALLQVLNLPTTDKDPDEDVYERSAREPAPASRARSERAAPARGAREPSSARTPQELAAEVKAATTVAQLRTTWKQAGELGHLQAEIGIPDDGTVMTLQDYLTRRSDELALSKSTAGTDADPASKVAGGK